MVSTETATVYRSGKYRFFTKKAAQRADAKAIINQKCECDRGDHITPPYTCPLHNDLEKYERMIHLLIVMFIKKASV